MWEKTFLSNMNGDSLPPPLKLFWRADLYDELVALEDMIFPERAPPKRIPNIEEDVWGDFITDFLAMIPGRKNAFSGFEIPPLPPSIGARALHWRIGQALSVVGGRLRQEIQGLPTAGVLPSHEVLLPMRLRARFELVLGGGYIPMVWMRATNLVRCKPLKERPPRPD